MNREDIQRYLDVSIGHSVTVDVEPVDGIPGYLRTITIHRDNDVSIEYILENIYINHDSESGELKYVGAYESLDVLLSDLEQYLKRPVEQWINFTAEPYISASLEESDPVKSRLVLEDMLRRGAVEPPGGAEYQIASPYWRHISKYGEFREDKIWEEQEEHLALNHTEDTEDE